MSENLKNYVSFEPSSVITEIQGMMEEIITAAETADAGKTFSYLTCDPGRVFFQNNGHYSRDALITLFREKYGNLHSQRFHVTHSEVIALSPESAMWMGYGEGRTVTKTGESAGCTFSETWIWQKIMGKWVAIHYHG
jgi:hypothetical protein